MRKEWTKPKLISLYRGRPEEAVLAGCKINTAPTSGPDVDPILRGCENNDAGCSGITGT
jgi:hypothetical protein